MIAAWDPLHVESRGEGPPIVLAHGFAGSARNWGPQLRALRDRFRVVAYDLRGHARSAPSVGRSDDRGTGRDAWTAEAFVEDLARVLDGLGLDRAIVGGLSLGAAVALGFARRHPERVRALVLASFPAGPGRAGAFSGSADEMARVLEEQGGEAAGARFVWGEASGLDERGAALVRQGFLEHDPLALARVLRGALPQLAGQVDAPDLAERLAMPVLLLAGEDDAGSREATRRIAARLPRARVRLLRGAGHVVNLAAPAAFNEALEDFLASVPD